MNSYDYSDCILSRYERNLLKEISNLKENDDDFVPDYKNHLEITSLQRLSDLGLICAINGQKLDMDIACENKTELVIVATLKGQSYKIYRKREILVTFYPLVISSLSLLISSISIVLSIVLSH